MRPTGRILIIALLAGLTACNETPTQSFERGLGYYQSEDFAKAADCFERAVQSSGATAQAWNYLGVCRLQTGNQADAIKAFQSALKLNDSHEAARYNLAMAFVEAKCPADAIPHLRQLARAAQVPQSVYLQLGYAYLQTGDWSRAKQTFEKLTGVDGNPELQNDLGVIETHLGNFKTARTHLDTAVRLNPGLAPAYLNLAVLEHQHLGHKPQAIQFYQKFLELSPNRDDVRYLIAKLTQEPAPRPKPVVEPPAAPKPAEPAPVVEPTPAPIAPSPIATTPPPLPKPVVKRRTPVAAPSPKAGDRAKANTFFNEAVAKQQQNQLSAAIASYQKALAADPTFTSAYYNLAIAYRDSRQPEKSLEQYELALATDPGFKDARYNYAIQLQQEGYNADAIAQYEKILDSHPNESAIHLTVATLYARDPAQRAAARQHYEAYLKLVPNSPLARDLRDWIEKNR